jgi:hypothetical protein
VSFVAITLCVASQRVFVVVVVYFVMTQCGKFWIDPRIPENELLAKFLISGIRSTLHAVLLQGSSCKELMKRKIFFPCMSPIFQGMMNSENRFIVVSHALCPLNEREGISK